LQRNWKPLFAVLRGPLLCFYSDKDKQNRIDDVLTSNSPSGTPRAAWQAGAHVGLDLMLVLRARDAGGRLSVQACICDIAHSYTKHPFVFRIQAFNGSEFLLRATSNDDMLAWIKAIQVRPS
jgi:hypothetical protein